jgi:HEAT repeat protein
MKREGNHAGVKVSEAKQATIDELIGKLGGEDGRVREDVRLHLATIGKPAVPALIEALKHHRNKLVRWEAAKTLGEIRDPMAAPVLVKVMSDKLFEIRWLAAEGLIAIGHEALIPLLNELVKDPENPWLLQGAHHVISHFATKDIYIHHHEFAHPRQNTSLKELLKPLLSALEGPEPSLEAPSEASKVLDELAKPRKAKRSK